MIGCRLKIARRGGGECHFRIDSHVAANSIFAYLRVSLSVLETWHRKAEEWRRAFPSIEGRHTSSRSTAWSVHRRMIGMTHFRQDFLIGRTIVRRFGGVAQGTPHKVEVRSGERNLADDVYPPGRQSRKRK